MSLIVRPPEGTRYASVKVKEPKGTPETAQRRKMQIVLVSAEGVTLGMQNPEEARLTCLAEKREVT